MYLVKNGRLQIVDDKNGRVIGVLDSGAVFGELSILDIPGNKYKNRRSATIQSIGYSTLYSLTKNDLWNAISDYPQQYQKLIEKGFFSDNLKACYKLFKLHYTNLKNGMAYKVF